MSTYIGLISDVHATPVPLQEALSIFHERKVGTIFCAGDIAGYGDALDETVQLLKDHDCQSILGNHDIWWLDGARESEYRSVLDYLNNLPAYLDTVIEGQRVYVAHAHPPYSDSGSIRLLDENGAILPEQKEVWSERLGDFAYDVLIVGHSHQVFAELLGQTLVVNPGSTKFNHSCAILKLPDRTVEWFSLANKTIVKAWNWGGFQIQQSE
jgi:putative phosphoesterase